MEQKWKISTLDQFTIYGTLNSAEQKSRNAIFIVHGLSGHMNEYVHKRAADYFAGEYDVYRFNLYGGEADARNLVDCTVQTHANDINTVLGYFSHLYEKIFLIGHSYGGLSIMMAQPQRVTAASLWDATFNPKQVWTDYPLPSLPGTEYHITQWGTNTLIGAAMHKEAERLDEQACADLAATFKSPVQVIVAGDGYFADKDVLWDSFAPEGSLREIVPGTEHCFYEGDTCAVLLQKTADWFKEF